MACLSGDGVPKDLARAAKLLQGSGGPGHADRKCSFWRLVE